ncbi:hypothetical protein DSO57_1029606 [Entomophthora muscae]|uniref:Uncharacterized protein n=1 Tax=Entomophthora muscae TaxID=34485 RepID=A0ACC2SE15_9FUNG|nr:hypothetical protein DSO57_1029606 [Entomophthora muscae]
MKLLFVLVALATAKWEGNESLKACMTTCGTDHECMAECEEAWADPLGDEVEHGTDHRGQAFVGDLLGTIINRTNEQASKEPLKDNKTTSLPENSTQAINNTTEYEFVDVNEVGTTFALVNSGLHLYPPLLPLILALFYL